MKYIYQMKAVFKGFVNTPPLWKKQQFGLQQFQFPEIDLSASDTMALPENLLLGHQMEVVFKNLISSSKAYTIVFSNLLIDEG